MEYFAFQWHITEACDQRCSHCYIYALGSHAKFQEMALEDMVTVLENCKTFCQKAGRLPYLYITGGDPILHPQFWALMKLLKLSNIPFALMGNPFHLTADVCRRLKDYGCRKYQLSLDGLREMHLDYQLLFIEAADEDIVRRYKETRHTHPLTRQGYSLPEAVKLERLALEPVRRRASHILNSTGLNLSKFRGELLRLFGMGALEESMTVSVTSFGFKYGIPIDADLVFDVRFLPNPYYIAELKECTGLEEAVRAFLFGYRQTTEFMRHLEELFAFLLPQYVEEGKSSLVIAVGCTGGHHRSVAVAHALTEFIRQKGYRVEETHRDISR